MRYGMLCLAILMCSRAEAIERIPLVIVDSYGRDEHCFRNLMLLADSVGFKTDYKTIYDILEDPDLSRYKAAIFFMSQAMINVAVLDYIKNSGTVPQGAPQGSPEGSPGQAIITNYLNAVMAYTRKSNASVAFLLPGGAYSPEAQRDAGKALAAYMLGAVSAEQMQVLNDFVCYITQSDLAKGVVFGTSLSNPGNSQLKPCVNAKGEPFAAMHDPASHACCAQTLPTTVNSYDARVQRVLPNALLMNVGDGIYLVSKGSEFDFAEVTENFFKNPLPLTYRTQLLNALQSSLQSLYDACVTRHISSEPIKTPPLPPALTPAFLRNHHQQIRARHAFDTHYAWLTSCPPSCGCVEYDDLFGYEDTRNKLRTLVETMNPNPHPHFDIKMEVEKLALRRNVEIIYDARFSCIWLGCVPEWYLGRNGMRADQRTKYVHNIRQFAHQMRAFFGSQRMPMPKIFVGMNITSNFRAMEAKNPVVDLFGTRYPHIPCPFDILNFWYPEVLEVFETFCASVGDVLPIDGVFFDFEMYHAPKEGGAYSDLMDFSDLAWHVYCLYADKGAQTITGIQNRIAYLQRTKKFAIYFDTLERASRELGSALKNKMRKRVPHLMFAAYAPTLPSSWFYRGIYAGLSGPRDPLLLATFNTDYASHHEWLLKHHIYIVHGSAILLSKLQNFHDCNLITQLLGHHDFVWYNRPSRMVYEYEQKDLDTVWWGIEGTTFDRKSLVNSIRTHHMNPFATQ